MDGEKLRDVPAIGARNLLPKLSIGAIFDLDGVLTDTAELHYRSWQFLANQLGLQFDRQQNEALRGLARMESLCLVLGKRAAEFSETEKSALAAQKNSFYLTLVASMGPGDLLPGVKALLDGLADRGIPMAIASSSKNARVVLDRLGIADRFSTIVDGNDAPESKPDPTIFLLAAHRLGVTPHRCVVIEDAESGVAAALAAGMKVVGVGPTGRVGAATLQVDRLTELTADRLVSLLG